MNVLNINFPAPKNLIVAIITIFVFMVNIAQANPTTKTNDADKDKKEAVVKDLHDLEGIQGMERTLELDVIVEEMSLDLEDETMDIKEIENELSGL